MPRIGRLNRLQPTGLPIAMSSAPMRTDETVTASSSSVVAKAVGSVPTKLSLQPIAPARALAAKGSHRAAPTATAAAAMARRGLGERQLGRLLSRGDGAMPTHLHSRCAISTASLRRQRVPPALQSGIAPRAVRWLTQVNFGTDRSPAALRPLLDFC